MERVEPILTPLGEPDLDGSYQRYLDSLEPCPGCGRVDEMDNIEGRLLCAACSLDEHDVTTWAAGSRVDGGRRCDWSAEEAEG